MYLFAAVLLTLAINWWVVRPLFASFSDLQIAGSDEAQQLLDHKQRCLQVLRDLELDFSTQKIGEHDFQTMKNQVSQELAAILSRIDALP